MPVALELYVPNSTAYRRDREDSSGDGVVILVKNSIHTTSHELSHTIRSLKKRKAPGADEIQNGVLKVLPPRHITALCNVTNTIMRLQYFLLAKTGIGDWCHVPSESNPADALSRGQLPEEFLRNETWSEGPSWLRKKEDAWPKTVISVTDVLPETRKISWFVTGNADFLHDFSSFTRLKRVVAYCLRMRPGTNRSGGLRPDELAYAEKTILKFVQTSLSSEKVDEITKRKPGKPIHKRLLALNPFVDHEGIMRVGGRLKNANISYAQQHPILLPRSHHVTDLIIRDYHTYNFHAGIQTTLYMMRQKYWVLDGRNQVRKIIRSCVRCFRANPPDTKYVMGDLPGVRVTQARPFANVGVDYCGPFLIKQKKHRNTTFVKSYVAVFVCLAVKAVHLEVVSDLTTEGFIAALRRFIARRGKPISIHSDNGTNFIGARNELKELYNLFQTSAHQERTARFLSDQGINWQFIPPLSPHFGGLWEATVKSFKHHLKRVVTGPIFTFEEFNTLTIDIEAIINSRPLCPMSNDPNDLLVLTPGHFLIGDILTSLPEGDYSHIPTNRLSRWQHIQKVRQDFWARWHKEYLNELNIRHKWSTGHHSIKDGTIVLIKENNVPSMHWTVGRVVKTYPGADGIVRTVSVKTATKNFSQIAHPLHTTTHKDPGFVWEDEQENPFQALKKKLCTAPVLAHYNPRKGCELRFDGCQIRIGAGNIAQDKYQERAYINANLIITSSVTYPDFPLILYRDLNARRNYMKEQP
ncbi:uncharacterized protein LOC112906159 [Agrilus planipennis]|uniref:Uncharacterized protein LOC112906159 n=1 Tax=Agrilus planipennis TaxID=224129 RepID=A0A7F5RI80_AGRPL|nr:uncharacterized protein LOC112906159 [Agrilus planipennis]